MTYIIYGMSEFRLNRVLGDLDLGGGVQKRTPPYA